MKIKCKIISGHRILKEAFKAGYKKALKESLKHPDPEEDTNSYFYVNGEPCDAGTRPESVIGDKVLKHFHYDYNAFQALFQLLSSETFEGVPAKELQITDEDILNNLQVHDQEPGAEEGVSLEWKTLDGRWISWPWNW